MFFFVNKSIKIVNLYLYNIIMDFMILYGYATIHFKGINNMIILFF